MQVWKQLLSKLLKKIFLCHILHTTGYSSLNLFSSVTDFRIMNIVIMQKSNQNICDNHGDYQDWPCDPFKSSHRNECLCSSVGLYKEVYIIWMYLFLLCDALNLLKAFNCPPKALHSKMSYVYSILFPFHKLVN